MRAQWTILAVVTFGLTIGAWNCAPPSAAPGVIRGPLTPEDAVSDAEPTLPGGKIPEKPYDWQKVPTGNPPKCGKKEVLIRAACYRRAHPDDYSPPCESPTVEWNGACFYAIHRAPREPSSIQR